MTAAAACERILRTSPRWFGNEASLLGYVRESTRLPTFLTQQAGSPVAALVKHDLGRVSAPPTYRPF